MLLCTCWVYEILWQKKYQTDLSYYMIEEIYLLMPEDAVLLSLNIPHMSIFMKDDRENITFHWMCSISTDEYITF